MLRESLYQPLVPTSVVVNNEGMEKELTAFQDDRGFILTREELFKAKDQLLKEIEKSEEFYALEGINESIRNTNIRKELLSLSIAIKFEQNENGTFRIPKADLKQKQFKPNLKRAWSFTCDWCGKKTSSKTDTCYYGFNFPHIRGFDHSHERACSKVCGEHIWIEIMKNWIYKKNYQYVFEFH